MRLRIHVLIVFGLGIVSGTHAQILSVGDMVSPFSLPCATKDSVHSAGARIGELGSSNVTILAFYPADWSGGCTTEMCTMRDNFGALAELGATVYGISGDYPYSHREWAKHLDLQFALLSDHDHTIAKRFNSFNEKTGYNKRTVFVIGRDGRIAYMDLAYTVRTPESFDRLKSALKEINQ